MNTTLRFLLPAALVASLSACSSQNSGNLPVYTTTAEAQITLSSSSPDQGWSVKPLFTVGETIEDYAPPGILDGLGAMALKDIESADDYKGRDVVRVFANHELRDHQGYGYKLANGTEMFAARVSYFDVDAESRELLGAGLAYDVIYDRNGAEVTDREQVGPDARGINRLCSSTLWEKGELGMEDNVYFTGEEVELKYNKWDGQLYALDIDNRALYCVPWAGRFSWESATLLDTGDPETIGLLIGDDRGPAPLWLYVGTKGGAGDDGFLDRNGLAHGRLYVWVSDTGELTPQEWNGTGTSRSGTFVEIAHHQPSRAGRDGFDERGFADLAAQDSLARKVGAFWFSRPEDVATDRAGNTRAVLASTGLASEFQADSWGTIYIIDVKFGRTITAAVSIAYDGDDAGGGRFSGPDFGIRSPDNLEWARNGKLYIQEDRALRAFGKESGMEAAIWELDPETAEAGRLAVVNRKAALPGGQTDGDPDDLGDWETSGVIDVTRLFQTSPGEILLAVSVQAHSVRDGSIGGGSLLVEGGQLVLLSGKTGNR